MWYFFPMGTTISLFCFFPLSSHLSLSLAHQSCSSTVAALLEFIIHESAWASYPAAQCAEEDSGTERLDLGYWESHSQGVEMYVCWNHKPCRRCFETQRARLMWPTAWGRLSWLLHDCRHRMISCALEWKSQSYTLSEMLIKRALDGQALHITPVRLSTENRLIYQD